MDIHTVAIYLKVGYRVRRESWKPGEYISELAGMLNNRNGYMFDPMLEDLLAEDWIVITTGIRKHFNKYANIEYDDEPNWDTYVIKDDW